jgi:acetyltransferase-like isoleucine patch superfamily enzyme
MIYKVFWALRALLYSPFFGSIKFPGYMGKPILIKGARKIFIGKRVRIFPHIRLEAHGLDGKITIGDDVGIAQNVHITSASNLTIGASTTILANVFITNFDHDYRVVGINILRQQNLIKETTIGENCFIGIGACIQAGTELGKQCIVGANAVVKGKFRDFSVIVGSPAKVVKRFNAESNQWEATDGNGDFLLPGTGV